MHIKTVTDVNGQFKRVFDRFDRDLLPFLRPSILRWGISITDKKIKESEAYFVDEGHTLPPPLVFWKHIHRTQAVGPAKTAIIDEVYFRTPHLWLDYIIAPIILLFLKLRRPLYRRHFR